MVIQMWLLEHVAIVQNPRVAEAFRHSVEHHLIHPGRIIDAVRSIAEGWNKVFWALTHLRDFSDGRLKARTG